MADAVGNPIPALQPSVVLGRKSIVVVETGMMLVYNHIDYTP